MFLGTLQLCRLKLIRIVLVTFMQSLFVRTLYIQANGNNPLYLCLDSISVAIATFLLLPSDVSMTLA